jgi:hypothetical protein
MLARKIEGGAEVLRRDSPAKKRNEDQVRGRVSGVNFLFCSDRVPGHSCTSNKRIALLVELIWVGAMLKQQFDGLQILFLNSSMQGRITLLSTSFVVDNGRP